MAVNTGVIELSVLASPLVTGIEVYVRYAFHGPDGDTIASRSGHLCYDVLIAPHKIAEIIDSVGDELPDGYRIAMHNGWSEPKPTMALSMERGEFDDVVEKLKKLRPGFTYVA